MEESKVSGNHLTSAAAFVEGGIQDQCDDACSICLEAFCDSDPSTLTSCKHEFHLQCVLEWCQRSSQCPMCWRPISLKDPACQELLEAVECERTIRMNPPRSTAIFHHPTLGDFELQQLPDNASESELEERIIQHLAAAAAMGRARQFAGREGRNRSSQGRPHYFVLSTHGNAASSGTFSSHLPQTDGSSLPAAVMITGPNPPRIAPVENSSNLTGQPSSSYQVDQLADEGSSAGRPPTLVVSPPPGSQDRAGPSDFQSFSESLKTRLSTLSTRYKETISKSTRGWKERLFAPRNNATADPFPDDSTEANQTNCQNTAAATPSRMMDHLQIAEEASSSLPPDFPEQSTAAYTATITPVRPAAASQLLNEKFVAATTLAAAATTSE